MSKKKHRNKGTPKDIKQAITRMLRVDFSLNEEEIELIENALEGRAPVDIVEHMVAIQEGKVELPTSRPTLEIEGKDGIVDSITLTNHPVILLHDYLNERFGLDFAQIYWTVLTAGSSAYCYEMLKFLKRAPFFAEAREHLRNRTTHAPEAATETDGGQGL